MEPNWTILTNLGLPGVMLGILFFIARAWIASNERTQMKALEVQDKKADAFAASLNVLGGKIDAHHTADIQSHQALATGIAELRGQVSEAINWQERTPVEQPVPRAAGTYGPQRPGSRG